MKKKIHVKHTHRYTKESSVLYDGECEFTLYDTYSQIHYKESDDTKVQLTCFAEYMVIERFAEVNSELTFIPKKRSENPMKSEYGTFHIEIMTYDYLCEDNYIMVEYDVESGSPQKDGFKIEINIKEDGNEYN